MTFQRMCEVLGIAPGTLLTSKPRSMYQVEASVNENLAVDLGTLGADGPETHSAPGSRPPATSRRPPDGTCGASKPTASGRPCGSCENRRPPGKPTRRRSRRRRLRHRGRCLLHRRGHHGKRGHGLGHARSPSSPLASIIAHKPPQMRPSHLQLRHFAARWAPSPFTDLPLSAVMPMTGHKSAAVSVFRTPERTRAWWIGEPLRRVFLSAFESEGLESGRRSSGSRPWTTDRGPQSLRGVRA
jgi:hypothetical protein